LAKRNANANASSQPWKPDGEVKKRAKRLHCHAVDGYDRTLLEDLGNVSKFSKNFQPTKYGSSNGRVREITPVARPVTRMAAYQAG
jgi:hypothetical protein